MMQIVSLVLTVVLALVGYLATYLYSLQLAKRKESLELINRRINDFYGPLYISTQTGKIAYETLLKNAGNKSLFFDPKKPPNNRELAEWRIWSRSVFMPLNEYCEKLILENAYLIREEEMPKCLIDFVTHVSAYKAIIEKWNDGDFSEHTPALDFPVELDLYAEKVYRELKAEQLKLIGQLKPKQRKSLRQS